MKFSQGLSVLALVWLCGAVIAEGAFWKKSSEKKSEETVTPVVAPPSAYQPEGSGPVQSLSRYQKKAKAPDRPSVSVPAPVATSFDAAGRRAHFLMPDQESIDTLVELAESRRLREEELRVLSRLLVEKEGELDRMNQRLQNRFGISPEANYQYDNETQSLFLLTAKPTDQVKEGAKPEEFFDKQLHMTLREKKMEVEFVRLVSAKKITSSELQVIRLLLKEKNLELSKLQVTLADRFAVEPDKHYEYDAASKTLYEVKRAGAAGVAP